MKKAEISEEMLREAARKYVEREATLSELARELHTSPVRLGELFNSVGVEIRRSGEATRTKVSDEALATAATRYAAKKASLRQIARELHVDVPRLKRLFASIGVEARTISESNQTDIDQDDLVAAAERYLDGKAPLHRLARELHVEDSRLWELFASIGVESKDIGWAHRTEISDESLAHAVARYESRETPFNHLADELHIGPRRLRQLFASVGVGVRDNREANRRCELNHEAFDFITPESAYWMGFIAADGSINQSKNSVAVALAIKDQEHLEKLRAFLASTHKVIRRPPSGFPGATGCVNLTFSSSKIVSRLLDCGLRTFNQSFVCDELSSSSHFWRGMIDGDGTVCLGRCRTRTSLLPQLSLVGGKPLLEQFAKFVFDRTGATVNVRPHSSIWRVTTGGSTAYRLASELYADAPVYLTRKYQRAIAIIQWGKDIEREPAAKKNAVCLKL